jgi:hypothetical protein
MITAQLCGEVYRVRSISLCTPGMSQGRTTKGRRAYGVPLRSAQGKGSLLYACPVAMEFRHLEYCLLASENHGLWAWSEMMALPVMVISLTWSNGVVDDWSNGRNRTGYPARRAKHSQVLCRVLDLQSPSLDSRPLLHYSITPTTIGSECTLLAPFQGGPDKATASGRGFFTMFSMIFFLDAALVCILCKNNTHCAEED